MKAISPPPSLNAQSDDNRVGMMFVAGLALLFAVWKFFPGHGGWVWLAVLVAVPGAWLLLLAIRRLFRPGCRLMLRINHGGITDFRLGHHPIPWEAIVAVGHPSGLYGWLFPVVFVQVHPPNAWPTEKTLWCRIIHSLPHALTRGGLLILCGTLDIHCRKIHETIQRHMEHRQGPPSGAS